MTDKRRRRRRRRKKRKRKRRRRKRRRGRKGGRKGSGGGEKPVSVSQVAKSMTKIFFVANISHKLYPIFFDARLTENGWANTVKSRRRRRRRRSLKKKKYEKRTNR